MNRPWNQKKMEWKREKNSEEKNSNKPEKFRNNRTFIKNFYKINLFIFHITLIIHSEQDIEMLLFY